jgi:hypothetical protein
LTDLDSVTKEKLNKNQRFWWFLPKKIRELFLKY